MEEEAYAGTTEPGASGGTAAGPPEALAQYLAEIESLNARLQEANEALLLSNVRQHELTERAELMNARLRRAMQESHHRIKNNLQVITALVEMQLGAAGETAAEYLRRLHQHIRILASIHDLLTQQAKNTDKVDYIGTQAVLGKLLPMLQQTSGGKRLTTEIADVLLPVDKAASLCLLISECVSNAIKHGKKEIEITFRAEDNRARLEICDDGDGFAPDFDPRKAARTGLSLIDSTARIDLRGEVRYENHSEGGRVAITFPLNRADTVEL